MAVLADYLAVATPEQIPNFFMSTFTIYLVATAWMTVRRKELILLFVPQLSSLGVLIFWMVRVRFTGWYKDLAPN